MNANLIIEPFVTVMINGQPVEVRYKFEEQVPEKVYSAHHFLAVLPNGDVYRRSTIASSSDTERGESLATALGEFVLMLKGL
jgi:hypothetical protein